MITTDTFNIINTLNMPDGLTADLVHSTLKKHMLVDGFDLVLDLGKKQRSLPC